MLNTNQQSLTTRTLWAMLLLAVMWGLSIPITNVGLETIPPLTLTAMRYLVAVPLLFFMAARRLWLHAKAIPHIVGLGVMGVPFAFGGIALVSLEGRTGTGAMAENTWAGVALILGGLAMAATGTRAAPKPVPEQA